MSIILFFPSKWPGPWFYGFNFVLCNVDNDNQGVGFIFSVFVRCKVGNQTLAWCLPFCSLQCPKAKILVWCIQFGSLQRRKPGCWFEIFNFAIALYNVGDTDAGLILYKSICSQQVILKRIELEMSYIGRDTSSICSSR